MPDSHITSIVVQAHPEAVTSLVEAINALPEAEVHIASAAGKLVVSLETETLHRVTELLDVVNGLQGVVSALLVYHQVEDTKVLDDVITTANSTSERTPEVLS